MGTARRHLEGLVARGRSDERARVMMEILKDPEATYRRLQAAMQRAAELEAKEGAKIEHPRSSLLDLLSAQKLSKASLPERNSSTLTNEIIGSTSSDNQVVGDDGTVIYQGKKYVLYRRYAGKVVTVIEDGEVVRFSVKGKVLSKTYPRDS